MNNHACVLFDSYKDYVPTYENYPELHGYFNADIFPNSDSINVLVTIYDEDVFELQLTLESLGRMTEHVKKKVRVVVIQDGWCRASDSVKDYLKNMLFPNAKEDWELLDVMTPNTTRTFVIQPVDDFAGELDQTWVTASIRLYLTFVIKTDNRQKHNSHSWFLRSFCKEYPSTYVFMTDVGTCHHSQCLARLEAFMDRNTGVAGCHGYPWIAEVRPHTSFIQRYIRAMQEYELGPLAVDHDRGFQAMFGFQQTLSGPCTMMRTEDITYPSLLKFLSSVLERPPSQLNILSSNLNIVEDTAMTLYMFASSGKHLTLVPDAYYYYDVETAPRRFFTQRRRWMNGVGCGLVIFWRTYHKILNNSLHSKWLQMLVRFIIAVGICMQVIFPFLQPVLFAYVVYQSFNPNFCSAFPHVLRGFQEAALRPYFPWLGTCATFGYMAWYCYWVAHYSKSAASFDERLFWITVVLTHTLGLYSYYMVLTVTIHVAFDLVPVWQRPIVAFLIGTHYTCPMVTAMLKRDWRTFQTSTVGILPYVAFFPMWSFIYGYNIARLWDVTWGNRYGVLNEKDEVQQKVTEYRAQSNRLTRYYLAGAVVVTGVICFSTSRYDASYLHVVYVVPWYMISAIMGLVSVLWTMQYQMHRETKGAPPIFRQSTYRRLNHYFTFGKEKSIYMV